MQRLVQAIEVDGQKAGKWFPALLVTCFPLLFLTLTPPSALSATSQPQKRFGFGFVGVGGLIVNGYTADLFFNAMFLTPPYPSTVQLTFGDGSFSTDKLNFVLQVMSRASAYPNIKLGLTLAWDATSSTAWTSMQNFVTSLASNQNRGTIGFVGVMFEQFNVLTYVDHGGSPDSTSQMTYLNQAQSFVQSQGFQFISYYPTGFKGTTQQLSNYLWLTHTNYPTSDPQVTLDATASYIVGITHGTDGYQIFPSVGCDSQAHPHWSMMAFAEGFVGTGYSNVGECHNQVTNNGYPPTIDQVLTRDAANPVVSRQWNFFIAGNSGTDYACSPSCDSFFVGVSRIITQRLWDNPVFRNEMANWIASNPGAFLQSIGSVTSTKGQVTSSTSTQTSSSLMPSSTSSTATSSSAMALTYPVVAVISIILVAGLAVGYRSWQKRHRLSGSLFY